MPSVVMPFDIFFTTKGDEHKDQENRMHLRQGISIDQAGRQVHRVFDVMGNASSRMNLPKVRGTTYPAAVLAWDARSPLKSTVCVGEGGPVPVDAWMPKVPGSSRSRSFIASDGHTYTWTQTERVGVWKCTNDMNYVVSEGSDDEYRTITVDQNRPWLGVEIFVSFYIMYHLTARH